MLHRYHILLLYFTFRCRPLTCSHLFQNMP
jgi:hypothetical protein